MKINHKMKILKTSKNILLLWNLDSYKKLGNISS